MSERERYSRDVFIWRSTKLIKYVPWWLESVFSYLLPTDILAHCFNIHTHGRGLRRVESQKRVFWVLTDDGALKTEAN